MMRTQTGTTPAARTLRGVAARAQQALAAAWGDRPLRLGVLSGLACFVFLTAGLSVYVHMTQAGNYDGPLMHGTTYPAPPSERAAGMRSTHPGTGWDGQFYFWVSNDLWVTPEVAPYTILPSYRYQRVGLPLLARLSGAMIGRTRTTPFHYFVTQFVVVSIGFGAVVRYLAMNLVNPAYSICWVFSTGMLLCLTHGLPDPTCDSLMLLSLIALMGRRLWLYTLCATLMCLGRETYVLIPFMVWSGTTLGWIRWGEPIGRIRAVLLTAVPGAVLLAWTAYLANRLGEPMLAASRDIPWGRLVDYPLRAAWIGFVADWRAGNTIEVLSKLVAVVTCVGGFTAAAIHARRSLPFLVSLPFLALLLCAGGVIWEDRLGHAKNALPFLVVSLLLLPYSKIARGILLLQFLLGASIFVHQWVLHPSSSSAYITAAMIPIPSPPEPSDPKRTLLAERKSSIRAEILSTQANPAYRGLWHFCHREPTRVKLTLTNTSTVPWSRLPFTGPIALVVSCRAVDAQGRQVFEVQYPIPKDIGPGEEVRMLFPIPIQRVNGVYTLRFSILETGTAWFQDMDPAFGCEIPNVPFTWSGL